MPSPVQTPDSTPRIPDYTGLIPAILPRLSGRTLLLCALFIASAVIFFRTCSPWIRILKFPSCVASRGNPVAISPDGQIAAHWTREGSLILDDLRDHSSRELLCEKDLSPQHISDMRLLFSANGNRLAISYGNGVVLFDLCQGSRLDLTLGSSEGLGAFSTDGHRLATLGPDVVEVWDTQTGKSLAKNDTLLTENDRKSYIGFTGLGFSPSADRLVVCCNRAEGSVILDSATLGELVRLESVEDRSFRMEKVGVADDFKRILWGYNYAAFAPDGERVFCWGTPSGHRPEHKWRREAFDAKTGLFVSIEMNDPTIFLPRNQWQYSFSADGTRRVLDGAVWELKRPDEVWTVTWEPAFWLTVVLFIVLCTSMVRDRRLSHGTNRAESNH